MRSPQNPVRIRGLRRNAVIAKLNQHVARTFDGIAGRIRQHVLQIVVREMEVAAQAETERIADESLQMRD